MKEESEEDKVPMLPPGTSTNSENKEVLWKRLGAALFYGLSSISIMIVNKRVLTVQNFPSFHVKKKNQNY